MSEQQCEVCHRVVKAHTGYELERCAKEQKLEGHEREWNGASELVLKWKVQATSRTDAMIKAKRIVDEFAEAHGVEVRQYYPLSYSLY